MQVPFKLSTAVLNPVTVKLDAEKTISLSSLSHVFSSLSLETVLIVEPFPAKLRNQNQEKMD